MTKENGYTYTFMGICIVLVIIFFSSCTTTKYIDRYHSVKDSTAERQNELLQQTLHETIENYEKQLKDSSGVRIEYFTDTVTLPARITIDRTGAIQAEGRLKSVQVSATRLQAENGQLMKRVDSLAVELEKEKATVKREVKTVTKNIKRSFPWWWIVVGVVIGWVGRRWLPMVWIYIKTKL